MKPKTFVYFIHEEEQREVWTNDDRTRHIGGKGGVELFEVAPVIISIERMSWTSHGWMSSRRRRDENKGMRTERQQL